MKVTRYFEAIRLRPDRAMIRVEWIQQVIQNPVREVIQGGRSDSPVGTHPRDGGRYLRVVLLADGETVHNAFFDRSFKP